MTRTTTTITTSQPSNAPTDLFAEFKSVLMWQEVQLLGALVVFMLVAQIFRKKDKLADARWADKTALRHARRKALKQIKQKKVGQTALYLGNAKSYPIPDAQRGITVLGVTDNTCLLKERIW